MTDANAQRVKSPPDSIGVLVRPVLRFASFVYLDDNLNGESVYLDDNL